MSVFSWGWATVFELGSDHLFPLIALNTQDIVKAWLAYALSIHDMSNTGANTDPSKK